MKESYLKKLIAFLTGLLLLATFTHKELTWVALGDSITYLNDHQNETGNRITKGYMTRVVEKLPYIHYVNQGHNGWTAVRIAEQIDKLGLTKADVYSIFLGTNDWWGGKPLGRFADYEQKTGPGTVYGAFAKAIDSIGRYETFPVVDLYHLKSLDHKKLVKFKRLKDPQTGVYTNYRYPKFVDIPFYPETDEYPYPMEAIDRTYDGLHPSDKGYELITQMLVNFFNTY